MAAISDAKRPHCDNPDCKRVRNDREIERMVTCATCFAVSYCSTECRRDHYPNHKKVCVSPKKREEETPSLWQRISSTVAQAVTSITGMPLTYGSHSTATTAATQSRASEIAASENRVFTEGKRTVLPAYGEYLKVDEPPSPKKAVETEETEEEDFVVISRKAEDPKEP